MNRVIRLVWLLVVGLAVASLARAADGPGARPKVWAVVIGVDRYEDGLIPPCEGATRDARAVVQWIEREANWGAGHVLRLDDNGSKRHGKPQDAGAHLRPTLENLDWGVVEWLGHRVGPDDIVVLYFAGQAVARAPRLGQAGGRVYLLPIDARGEDVHATGWSLDDALDQARWPAEKQARVVIWLDTSPQGRGRSVPGADKGGPSGRDWLRALTRWPGVTAWLAADGQVAPDSGSFVAAIRKASGTSERAHNLLGTLRGVLDDPAMLGKGFRSMGGVGPEVSLWSRGALVVENAQPELIAQSGHGDRVTSVLVSADNARMITASEDSTVRVWSTSDRSLLRVLTDPLVGVGALAVDRDGSVLVAGDGLGRLTGWDMTLDRPRSFVGPPEHLERVVDLTFLPEGKLFVALDQSGRAILWDAGGGALRKVRDLADGRLGPIAAAARPDPDATALVAAVEPGDGGPGSLLGFDPAGKALAKFDGPGGRIASVDLSADGRRAVVGDDDGRVVVLNLGPGSAEAVAWRGQFAGAVRLAKFANSGSLLISDQKSSRLVEPRAVGPSVALVDPDGRPIAGELGRSSFSGDGRWLAACTRVEGRCLLWRLAESNRVEPVVLPGDDVPGLSPAFAPDGRTLVIGDALGGLKSWDLDEAEGQPRAFARPIIPPSRGRVAALSPSPSGRYLLEITRRDDLGLVWDLEEGRGCKPLPGNWIAGAFLPDESRLVLVQRPDEGGRVVVFDRLEGQVLRTFEPPPGMDGRPSEVSFGPLAVAKSGRWVASAAQESQGPLACVWRVDDGRLVHVVRDHDEGITAVDFAGDEATWLTASADGSVRLWAMDAPEVEQHREAATLRNPSNSGKAITTARINPADPSRVVAGTRGGDLLLWNWAKGQPTSRVVLEHSTGEVNAATFSGDGRWLAASWSLGKSARFWPIRPGVNPGKPVGFAPLPHHGEQVGALAGWPGRSLIVSGGDDSAVKFWDLDQHVLVGTLLAQVRDDRRADWLAYTPEGLFDGSRPGEAMVKWRVGEKIVTLEQSQDVHHAFQLARDLTRGVKAPSPRLAPEGPRLKIAEPSGDRTSTTRTVELTIWSGDADPAGLRLYQNGIPVRGDDTGAGPGIARDDFNPGPGPNFRTTTVSLRRGANRFYVMASKPGTIDGRSDDLTLRYEGPEPPGRVHVLALGISRYEKRPLKYAHVDAERISEVLQSRGLDQPGRVVKPLVLTDEEVTPSAVADAFRLLRDAVKGRPEDTVVLFLAGHTDTDLEANQFCLLLPRFPFEPAPPNALELTSRGTLDITTRGSAGGKGLGAKVNSPDVLPYATLYNRLAHLDAMQRLVIIDACQAGAILEDSAVRNLQRVVERGSRKARNSYLLAARRGEPANEADALRHGLLTYTLLRGMKAGGLMPIADPPGPPSADLDHDGTVTSAELAEYADQVLPRLAAMFPGLVARAGNAAPNLAEAGPPALEQRLKIQSAETSFPLIAVPR